MLLAVLVECYNNRTRRPVFHPDMRRADARKEKTMSKWYTRTGSDVSYLAGISMSLSFTAGMGKGHGTGMVRSDKG